jgi:hypothetical protein
MPVDTSQSIAEMVRVPSIHSSPARSLLDSALLDETTPLYVTIHMDGVWMFYGYMRYMMNEAPA